jgi:hypothetical protein
MLTLRQIEVIRAIMITGSVGGAARLLNVSSPGISRVMKHAEALLGLKLFSRKGGRYTPTREASDIFSQEDLELRIGEFNCHLGARHRDPPGRLLQRTRAGASLPIGNVP